jgi:hypothetical protein
MADTASAPSGACPAGVSGSICDPSSAEINASPGDANFDPYGGEGFLLGGYGYGGGFHGGGFGGGFGGGGHGGGGGGGHGR